MQIRQKRNWLDRETCESLNALLNNGFALRQAAEILADRRNEAVFQQILARLENGEEAESFLHLYLCTDLRPVFSIYVRYMPLADALDLSVKLTKQDGEQKRILMKGIFYPLGLLASSMAGILLFCRFILPVMLGLMESFHMEQGGFALMAVWIRTVTYASAGLFLVLAICTAVLTDRKRIARTYRFLAIHFPASLPVQYASRDFTRFYLECLRRGLSTRRILQMLAGLETKPLVACIAEEADRLLDEGDAFEEAVKHAGMEPALAGFFRIAVYAGDCEGILEGYLAMFKVRTEKQIRNFSRIVQAISYGAVGLMIVLVYSVLMVPMRMLSEI